MDHEKELAVTYAALLLRDCGAECSEATLQAVTQAAGLKIPVAYFSLFSKFFADHPVQKFFGAAGGSGDVEAPAGKGKDKAKDEKKDAGKGKETTKAAEKPAAKAAPAPVAAEE